MLNEMGIVTDETNDDANVHDFIKYYIPDFSIRYYTCESFIFTSINDTFELSKNFDYLIKHRIIVTDLRNTLKFKLSDDFLDNSTSTGPFYKAEIMSSRALDLIAKMHIEKKRQAIVLYIIEMNNENDIQQLVQPCANITFISCTSHEPEIMFSIIPNETELLMNITDYYLSKAVGQEIFYDGIQARVNYGTLIMTKFLTIGDYYSSILMKNYDKVEYYYQKFLKEECQSPEDFNFEEQPIFYYSGVRNLYYRAHGHINLQLARTIYEQEKYRESVT